MIIYNPEDKKNEEYQEETQTPKEENGFVPPEDLIEDINREAPSSFSVFFKYAMLMTTNIMNIFTVLLSIALIVIFSITYSRDPNDPISFYILIASAMFLLMDIIMIFIVNPLTLYSQAKKSYQLFDSHYCVCKTRILIIAIPKDKQAGIPTQKGEYPFVAFNKAFEDKKAFYFMNRQARIATIVSKDNHLREETLSVLRQQVERIKNNGRK